MDKMIDLIVSGNIRTFSAEAPMVPAMGIKNGRVAAYGSVQELSALAGPDTRLLDLQNKTILPGLCDTHIHGLSTALLLAAVKLTDVTSVDDTLARLGAKAETTPAGQMVVGSMFSFETVAEYRFPTRQELDAVSAKHPIVIIHLDCHSCAANSLFLAQSGMQPGLPGVELDSAGEMTGKVCDPTIMDIHQYMSTDDNHDLQQCIDYLVAEAVKNGLTSLTLKEFPPIALDLLKIQDRFPVNLDFMVIYHDSQTAVLDEILAQESLRQHVTICFFADGSCDNRTAAYSHPYAENPDNYGMLVYSSDKFLPMIEKVHRAGFQVSVHACGDAAIEQVLSLYEKVLTDYPRADHRHRIEHFESPTVAQIKRAAKLGVALAMQPEVATFYAEETPDKLIPLIGQVNYDLYCPFRTLLDEGCLVAGGSDAPINSLNPFAGIQALLNNPQKRYAVNLSEAFEIYTRNAAKISFAEDRRGSLDIGMQADFIVLNQDPYRTRPEELGSLMVERTYVKGREVFAAE